MFEVKYRENEIIQRFTTYAKVDTQSNDDSQTCPSTPGQLDLARLLVEELQAIGMQEVTLDENGYVMATLPANTDKDVPTIRFLSHLDTATDFTGANVNPQIVDNYDGNAIILNEALQVVLSPADFPELANYKGHTLITTDGTTLLGADDKAGIAEIMTAMAYLIQHPEIKHGKVRVAFTPDEEIGRGLIASMSPPSVPSTPIPWTAARSANSNTRASTRHKRRLRSRERMSTPDRRRAR